MPPFLALKSAKSVEPSARPVFPRIKILTYSTRVSKDAAAAYVSRGFN